MGKIIAETMQITITVEEVDGVVTVITDNGDGDFFKEVFDDILAGMEPMGGTFYPEKGTMLAYYHVLKNSWFANEVASLNVEGDVGEMPHEDDSVIY